MSLSEDILIKVDNYLGGTLNEEDKINFELELSNNKELQDYLALNKEMRAQYNDVNWQFLKSIQSEKTEDLKRYFRSEEAKDIKESISKVNRSFNKQKFSGFRKWIVYSGAAVIALLISVYIITTQNQTPEEIYSNYINTTELSSIIDRGDEDEFKELYQAQVYFENKEYSKAVIIFSKEFKNNSDNSNIYLYLAISQMELNQFQEAEKTLNLLMNTSLIDAKKGYWYKSLLYLKSNQIAKSQKELQIIIDNSYFKKEEAEELIKKIK